MPLFAVLLIANGCASKPEASGLSAQSFSTEIVALPLDAPKDAQAADPETTGSVSAQAAPASTVPTPTVPTPTVIEPLPEAHQAAQAPRKKGTAKGVAMTLQEAVFATVTNNPKVGISSSRAMQAGANINIARSGAAPQVSAEVGVGADATSNVNGRWYSFESRKSTATGLAAAKLSLKKLIFDFGATQSNIDRAEKLYAAELFRRYDTAEDLAAKTIDAYLRVHEQTSLLKLTRENLLALQEIGRLVKANEQGGNATQADVSRVETTLADARKTETDQESALESALDDFRRLTKLEPDNLAAPLRASAFVPSTQQEAERLISEKNPQLLALKLDGQALQLEADAIRAGKKPKVELEIESTNKTHDGTVTKQDTTFSAMVYMRKNLYDGGNTNAQISMAEAKQNENNLQYFDLQDELVFDMRRQYRAVSAAREKQADLQAALDAASDVKRLYKEQFKAGTRTLFELLDSQTAYTNARRDEITNTNESLRAEYDILRTTGQLLTSIFPR
jgi:adhesin transport system outer membrane protein